jgi:hypothetical protein
VKVHELIEKLSQLDPELEVVCLGPYGETWLVKGADEFEGRAEIW